VGATPTLTHFICLVFKARSWSWAPWVGAIVIAIAWVGGSASSYRKERLIDSDVPDKFAAKICLRNSCRIVSFRDFKWFIPLFQGICLTFDNLSNWVVIDRELDFLYQLLFAQLIFTRLIDKSFLVVVLVGICKLLAEREDFFVEID
jgi:hypothetical protein